jgi:hypothetical protein
MLFLPIFDGKQKARPGAAEGKFQLTGAGESVLS